jgi:cell division control protein 6
MEDIFEKELQKSTVFQDRNVLSAHYVPETLPYREKEIKKIMESLAPALSRKRTHNLFIYGKTGVGKTAATRYVIEKLIQVKSKYNVNVDSIYINCRIINTKYQVLLKCAEYTNPTENFMGFPFSHLFSKFTDNLRKYKMNFVVVLDEIDKVKDLDDLMYTLTRSNDEMADSHMQIVGISNNVNFKKELDPRTMSTLCEEEMIFPPYNADQLRNILGLRVKNGYKKGVVSEGSINLASALAAQESGDARYALKLMLKAGEIADSAEEAVIKEEHVQKARKGVEEEIVYEIIDTLPEHQKIALYSIAQLTANGRNYSKLDGKPSNVIFSGEVYEKYEGMCNKIGKDARSARWCREYINDLEMLGLITTTLSGKGVRGNTTLIKLAFPSNKIIGVLEKSLGVGKQ